VPKIFHLHTGIYSGAGRAATLCTDLKGVQLRKRKKKHFLMSHEIHSLFLRLIKAIISIFDLFHQFQSQIAVVTVSN
jgi:hypothetical protein